MTKKGKGAKGPHISRPLVSTASQISEADRALFTAEELAALEDEVVLEVQEDMKAEAKDRVRERIKAQKRLEMQRAIDPDEEVFYLTVDLAPYAPSIILDGVIYLHGSTYEVPKRQYDTMREIVARTWGHEHSIGNANSEFYRKPRNVHIGPKDTGLSPAQIMRV